ncbi:efflux RND transporter periplasmic adaptor subunit [Neisseriaceae bacterium PsAf]|nr:efflux RND transporter periplasmic adaptor subunit [Neisseriaceae bacterium PsAf]MCV2503294.1 efflux RND transporter periplasmic adaptor subunit [Neisseriaceae bacterium]
MATIEIDKPKSKTKRFFTKKRIIIFSIILFLIIIYLLFASIDSKPNTQTISEKVERQDIVAEVITSGQLRPYKETTVGAQVTGEIQNLYIDVGDKVEKGQLIAELDPTVQQNNLDKAKNTLVSAQADLSSLERKLAVAKSDLNSYSMLYKNGATSRAEYDKYLTLYKETSNNVIQAKTKVNQAKLDVDNMTKNFSYAKIVAPMSGVIVSLPVEVGQTLTAGYNTPTIATIAQMDKMTIKAQVSEADIYNIKPGQRATFTVVGNNSKEYPSEVEIVHPAPTYVSDKTNSTASTYYYTTLIVNEVDENFRIDMRATVHIITEERKNVIAISNSAITEKDDKKYVTLIDSKGKEKIQEIQTGFTNNIKTEILSGLKEGDTVLKESVDLE